MAAVDNMGFLYPGLNMELRHRIDDWDRIYSKSEKDNNKPPPCFYPIGASSELRNSGSRILQMREVAMMMLMDKITDKERWHEKVLDDDIVAKWKQEALESDEHALYDRIMWEKRTEKIPFPEHGRIMSEACFEYCIAELRDKAKYFRDTNLIPTLDSAANTVVKSDTLIPQSLHHEIGRAFEKLKADQKGNEDWHPGSDGKQLNLVHPSMYPLVWGRSSYFQEEIVGTDNSISLALQGQPTPKQTPVEQPEPHMRRWRPSYNIGSGKLPPELWSSTYQWLPSTVSLGDDGKPRFTSYINNLDPERYSAMYGTIERLVDAVIPAWDQCLQEYSKDFIRQKDSTPPLGRAGRQDTRFEEIRSASDSDEDKWVPFDLEYWKASDAELSDDDLEELEEKIYFQRQQLEDEASDYHGEETGETVSKPNISDEALAEAKWERHRAAIYPEPKSYAPVEYTPTKSIREMFKANGLQIVVKMASIELTPEKPDFPGGGWHIEGQMNERICATALYYVDCENVTDSKLAFRMSTDSYVSDKIQAGQDEYNWLERVFGVSLGNSGGLPDACLQTFGDVETRQGRVLAFPNVFQHRVSPFSLQDKSKPGHRQFIALWLIDPHQRILSTANVPPQQADWWERHVRAGDSLKRHLTVPGSLMGLDEAREHRQKLMDERTYVGKAHEAGWLKPEYSFCEH